MSPIPVAILAGGLATRLGSITSQIPKALIKIGNECFARYQLEILKKSGLKEIVLCVGHFGEQIVAELGDGRELGMSIQYSFDGPKRLGTGGALKKALGLLGDSFFVLYGDSYLDCDYRAIESAYRQSGKLGLMTVFCNRNCWDRSNVWFDRGRIRSYDKKQNSPDMQHIDYGLGILGAESLAAYPENSTFDLELVYQDLIARNQLAGCEVSQRFYEIGSPAGLIEITAHLQTKMV